MEVPADGWAVLARKRLLSSSSESRLTTSRGVEDVEVGFVLDVGKGLDAGALTLAGGEFASIGSIVATVSKDGQLSNGIEAYRSNCISHLLAFVLVFILVLINE